MSDRPSALLRAGEMMGLKDMDLLAIANPDLTPAAAVAALHQTYPGAFNPRPRPS